MTDSNFTLQELEQALGVIYEAELQITNEKLAQMPPIKPSEAFNKKMAKLLRRRQSRYYTLFNTAGKRAAAFILCFLIAGTATVMNVQALRENFFRFLEKIYPRYSDVTFKPLDSSYTPPETFEEYSITKIPKGFELDTSEVAESFFIKEQVYVKEESYIDFSQHPAYKADFTVDTEGVSTQTVWVEDTEFLIFSNKGIQYVLWVKDDYAFLIHSDLSMREVMKMALSVEK